MPASLLARFSRTFFTDFFTMMREEVFDKIVLLAGIIYALLHKLITERWEFIVPIVWSVCVMVVYHAFKAAHTVSKDITAEIQGQSGKRESIIFTATGERASFTVIPAKPFLYRTRLYGIACVLLCLTGFAGVYVWKLERSISDPRPMFIRELDKPLIGIYVIATLRANTKRNDLGKFGLHIQLHDTYVNPERPGLFLSAFPTTEQLPTFRPPFMGPSIQGMKSAVWSSPSRPSNNNSSRSFSVLSNVFVTGYESLDRIEAGGQINNSPFSVLGDLNHAFIQIVASGPLTKGIKQISLVANNYVIYSISGAELSWEPIKKLEASLVLPAEMLNLELAQIKLSPKNMNLNFEELQVRKHEILFSGITQNGLVGISVLPGEHGWLPKEN